MIDEPGFYKRLESPIEARFAYCLKTLEVWNRATVRFLADARRADEIEAIRQGKYSGLWLHVFLQEQIGPDRVDFLVVASLDTARTGIVVECDGREFHQDRLRDLERDCRLRDLGYSVIRFSGSEIWRNAPKCAERLLDHAARKLRTPSPMGDSRALVPLGQPLRSILWQIEGRFVGHDIGEKGGGQ